MTAILLTFGVTLALLGGFLLGEEWTRIDRHGRRDTRFEVVASAALTVGVGAAMIYGGLG